MSGRGVMPAAPRPGIRRRPFRLLHTSDVHLGAYDRGSGRDSGELREAVETNLRAVVDVGLRERVDLVLIAGDFFDNARVHDETLRFAAEQIARADVPVVIGPGNHDHVGDNSVYDRFDLTEIAQNLCIQRSEEGETTVIEELDVEIWGRAHTERSSDFLPFADPPPRGAAGWQIGIGHGHFIHPRAVLRHSFHIREEELAESQRDYVALGHWEQLTRVAAGPHTTAAYSGAPQSLAVGSGLGGRVLLVEFAAEGDVCLTAHSIEGADPLRHDDIPLLQGAPDRA